VQALKKRVGRRSAERLKLEEEVKAEEGPCFKPDSVTDGYV
jgi:hypothetical protein